MKTEELVGRARRYKELGDMITEAEKLRAIEAADIVKELRRRRRLSLDAPGITVTRMSRRVGYKLEVLEARLRPAVFKRATRLVPDAEKLKKELKDGTLTEADLEAAEVRGSEFVKVTLRDDVPA